ncbi:pyridoxal-phosphate dependent enzyme [Shimazuella kribbensis]|uniref:pyridoxal-phosphate dependent enzyme n=1 Tax=Shimazuella kribbensis TaxID=139808 RepID=UPI00040787B7|nr:pyridoxal-phosphate dependent enzyme [Shimazuella kribbensis]
MSLKVDYSSVRQALERIDRVVHHTPVMTSKTLNNITGYEIFLKCENFQRGGAFKFRGAYNTICQLTKEEKEKGVIAFSSGNHAQAVALASKLLGVHAVNCMPSDSPSIKKEAAKGYGGESIFYDRFRENREEIASRFSEEKGMSLIPPYDDPRVIAGAGTAALELLQEVESLDTIVVPIGGGGLISGTSIAAHGFNSKTRIFGVEPESANDTLISLRKRNRISIDPSNTIADGLRATTPGTLTFPIIQEHVEDIVTVTDDEIMRAIYFAVTRLKIIMEPSAAVTLAALLANRFPIQKKRIGVIVSGGNIDPLLLAEVCQLNSEF